MFPSWTEKGPKISRRRLSMQSVRQTLNLESLEDRSVPTAFSLTPATSLPNGMGIDFFGIDDAGTKMVYSTTGTGFSLKVRDLTNNSETTIASGPPIFRPVISGDGSTIAFFSNGNYTGGNADNSLELFTHKGNAFTQVTNTSGASALGNLGATASLNFDGSKLAFSFIDQLDGPGDGDLEIFVSTWTGAGLQQLTNKVAGANLEINNFPVLSGNGNRIVYQVAGANGVEQLATRTFSGSWSAPTLLTNNDITNSMFGLSDLSADGNFVVYAGVENPTGTDDINGTSQIFRINTSNLSFNQITAGTLFNDGFFDYTEDSYLPSISSDGSSVVFGTYADFAGLSNPSNFNTFGVWNAASNSFSNLTPNYTSITSTSSYDGTAISGDGTRYFFAIPDQDPNSNTAFATDTEQIYGVSTSFAYDFENAAQFTRGGFNSVQGISIPSVGASTGTLYTTNGFGWVGTAALSKDAGSVYGATERLIRDFNYDSVSRTFRAFVGEANTDFFVTALVSGGLNGMTITGANGTVIASGLEASTLSNIVTPTNQVQSIRFRVTSNSSGLIDLSFATTVAGTTWGISGLILSESAIHTPLTVVRQDSNASPVLADGTSLDTYVGSGATGGSLIDLSTSLGTIVAVSTDGVTWTADASSLYAGAQVIAGGTGTFYFRVQRPNLTTAGASGNIVVHAIDGAVHGTFTQAYSPLATSPPVGINRKIDMDPNVNSKIFTPTGWDNYRGGVYNSNVGYGWTNTAGLTTYLRTSYNGPTPEQTLLNRDGHFFNQTRDFQIDVTPNTAYTINIGFGDAVALYDKIKVEFIGGTSQMDLATTTANRFIATTVSGTSDASGKITIRFSDLGGSSLGYGVTYISAMQGAPLITVSSVPQASAPVSVVTAPEVQALVTTAVNFWAQAGATSTQIAVLQNATIQVANLGGSLLGVASGNTITIDDDANGLGWSKSATNVAAGKVDLLTVLLHEMGHLIGLADIYAAGSNSIMTGTLNTGVRRTPQASDLAPLGNMVNPVTPVVNQPAFAPIVVGANSPAKSTPVVDTPSMTVLAYLTEEAISPTIKKRR